MTQLLRTNWLGPIVVGQLAGCSLLYADGGVQIVCGRRDGVGYHMMSCRVMTACKCPSEIWLVVWANRKVGDSVYRG
jgi:hypothetical protein